MTDREGVDVATIHATGRIAREVPMCCYTGCEAPPSAKVRVPLCDTHAIKVYREVHAVITGREPSPTPVRTGRAQPRHADLTQGRVYFLLQGHRVKIGFSTNVPQRVRDLGGGEVLATIPGTIRTEQALHRQFKALNDEGEWFWPGRELMAYISGLAA